MVSGANQFQIDNGTDGMRWLDGTASFAERMRLTPAGWLGIGTAGNPSSILHTKGGNILFESSGDIIGFQPSGNKNITMYSGDSDTEVLRINYRGYNFGTGRFRDFLVSDGKGASVIFVDGSAGSVGIGHASPAAKLDINQANASGAICCLELDQDDEDFAFTNYVGTEAADDSKNISTGSPTGSTAKWIKIKIGGTDYWFEAVTWA